MHEATTDSDKALIALLNLDIDLLLSKCVNTFRMSHEQDLHLLSLRVGINKLRKSLINFIILPRDINWKFILKLWVLVNQLLNLILVILDHFISALNILVQLVYLRLRLLFQLVDGSLWIQVQLLQLAAKWFIFLWLFLYLYSVFLHLCQLFLNLCWLFEHFIDQLTLIILSFLNRSITCGNSGAETVNLIVKWFNHLLQILNTVWKGSILSGAIFEFSVFDVYHS